MPHGKGKSGKHTAPGRDEPGGWDLRGVLPWPQVGGGWSGVGAAPW